MEKGRLRNGITTGTCAAAAAKAAAVMLLTGEKQKEITIWTPKGTEVKLALFHVEAQKEKAVCAVRKDAGDDPDVTDGMPVFASVELVAKDGEIAFAEETVCEEVKTDYYIFNEGEENSAPIFLTGKEGVGIVTKPGLSCPVGMPAINPVPRSMIFGAVEEVRKKAGFSGALLVSIWLPKGEKLAEKTFNPRLGIQGGLSILGTTGIVKPMSEEALKATIRLELHMKAAEGRKNLILVPGNYGETFVKDCPFLSLEEAVTCSNFIGESLKMAKEEGFLSIVLAGHIGKLIKVAGGVPNTHSKYGDRRMEILWECAEFVLEKDLRPLDLQELKHRILSANTMEDGAGILREYGLLSLVMEEAVKRIQAFACLWAGGIETEVVTFSTEYGILGRSEKIKQEMHKGGNYGRNYLWNRSGSGGPGTDDVKSGETNSLL